MKKISMSIFALVLAFAMCIGMAIPANAENVSANQQESVARLNAEESKLLILDSSGSVNHNSSLRDMAIVAAEEASRNGYDCVVYASTIGDQVVFSEEPTTNGGSDFFRLVLEAVRLNYHDISIITDWQYWSDANAEAMQVLGPANIALHVRLLGENSSSGLDLGEIFADKLTNSLVEIRDAEGKLIFREDSRNFETHIENEVPAENENPQPPMINNNFIVANPEEGYENHESQPIVKVVSEEKSDILPFFLGMAIIPVAFVIWELIKRLWDFLARRFPKDAEYCQLPEDNPYTNKDVKPPYRKWKNPIKDKVDRPSCDEDENSSHDEGDNSSKDGADSSSKYEASNSSQGEVHVFGRPNQKYSGQ